MSYNSGWHVQFYLVLLVSRFRLSYVAILYVTVPEKGDLVTKNKKIEFLMLVGRFNPPLTCVTIIKDYLACAAGQPA